MKTILASPKSSKFPDTGAQRRFQEFLLIFRDPAFHEPVILWNFYFCIYPVAYSSNYLRRVYFGRGRLDFTYFARYFDSAYGPYCAKRL